MAFDDPKDEVIEAARQLVNGWRVRKSFKRTLDLEAYELLLAVERALDQLDSEES